MGKVIPIFNRELSCKTCTLDKDEDKLASPKMPPTGAKRPLVYVLGEAPGADEDAEGRQFVGKAGQFLRKYFPKDLLPLIRWNNTIRCRPTNGRANRPPTDHEVLCCAGLQFGDIERTQPDAIFAFGGVPLMLTTGTSQITAWEGMRVPVRIGSHTCWLFPMMHPSYVMRKEHMDDGASVEMAFAMGIDRALRFLSLDTLPAPWVPHGKEIDSGLEWQTKWGDAALDEIEARLADFMQEPSLGYDYETTSLDPYSKDPRILVVGIGTWEKTYSFCVDHSESKWTKPQRKRLLALLRHFLFNYKGELWAHNSKFEMEWSALYFGVDALFKPRWHCSLSQVYCINEKYRKALEDRTIATMGINVKRLCPVDTAKLDKTPLEKVLRYNGFDVKYTHRLQRIQRKELQREHLWPVYLEQARRARTLAWMQMKGWVPDHDEADRVLKKLDRDIGKTIAKISGNGQVKAFERKLGEKFNPAGEHVRSFFRDYLDRKEGWRGDKYSTDEEALSQIRHPVARGILDYRGFVKLRSTYVKPATRGGKHIHADGLIHPQFNACRTRTRRTASEDPNGQNYPKHKGMKYIRNVITCPDGTIIVSIDFGQIEYRAMGMASEDERIVYSLWHKYDVHMAWAKAISEKHGYVLARYEKEGEGDDEKILKLFRQDVKNQWTFPLFFGSELAPVARSLDMPERELAPFYKDFWQEFAGMKKWQKRMVDFYNRHGYVELLTGWRSYGPLSVNQIINTPIQGTASDIVLDAANRLSYMAWKTGRHHFQPIMNIHDDLEFYFPKESLDSDIEEASRIMVDCRFPFINVPLTVEVALGTHWGQMEEVHTFSSEDFK